MTKDFKRFIKKDDEGTVFGKDDNGHWVGVNVMNQMANETYSAVLYNATIDFFAKMDKKNPVTTTYIENELLRLTNDRIVLRNTYATYFSIRDTWTTLKTLDAAQLALIAFRFHAFAGIDTAENGEGSLLGMFINDPNDLDYGIYKTDDKTIFDIIIQYDFTLSKEKFEKVYKRMLLQAKPKTRCKDPDLVPLANGVLNYRTKQLLPFNPDMVFLAKSRVRYDVERVHGMPPPTRINLDGTIWNPDEWMNSLSDDPAIVTLLWKILGCHLRPFVSWRRSVWLYSQTGNNGKGTLCVLMRNLCGNGTHTSIALSEFDKDFALTPLFRATSIIVDENNVGRFIDASANLKAVTTNDIIRIDRKFKDPVSFRFWGFMTQCINELPRVRDKSDSFYRRQILVPMEKCFTGIENTKIKDVYLNDPEILEYFAWRILNMPDYYELEMPDKCRDLLGSYKQYNDPVREFWADFKDRFVWDLVPWDFLYDLFLSWYKRTNPQGKPEGRTSFKRQLEQILEEPEYGRDWDCPENQIRVTKRMGNPEMLINEYNLDRWKNPLYINGKNITSVCIANFQQDRYRGILRRANIIPGLSNLETGEIDPPNEDIIAEIDEFGEIVKAS